MVTVNDVVEGFRLSSYQKEELEHCIEVYSSAPFSFTGIAKRISIVARSLFSEVEWTSIKRTLEIKSCRLVEENSSAEVLAEFILRYLTAKRSLERGADRVSRSFWKRQGLETITLQEIIDRAPRGNGKRLPAYRHQDLSYLLRKEHLALQHDYEELCKSFDGRYFENIRTTYEYLCGTTWMLDVPPCENVILVTHLKAIREFRKMAKQVLEVLWD